MIFFFLMIRRPPRSTQSRSSAASDVYKRQERQEPIQEGDVLYSSYEVRLQNATGDQITVALGPVSYTHLRAHETVLDLVCRLLLEKKKYSQDMNY